MRIRRAALSDAAALSAFGRRLFRETFAAENNPDDLGAYLDRAYTETQQREELEDPAIETLLLEDGGLLVAFAQLREGAAGNGVDGERPIELWRFYVDFPWHGQGVASTLMTAVEAAARSRGARTLWLGVWERNIRAQAFYRKQGFTVVGSQIFMIGSDPQRDLIMSKNL